MIKNAEYTMLLAWIAMSSSKQARSEEEELKELEDLGSVLLVIRFGAHSPARRVTRVSKQGSKTSSKNLSPSSQWAMRELEAVLSLSLVGD